MKLLHKELDLEGSPIIYRCNFDEKTLREDYEVRGGTWHAENGWLIGENRENNPGMVISKQNYFGDIMLDFKASTVAPCTHDINVMWHGSWREDTNTRDIAYVAGLQGWWEGKVGFEKSPKYVLNAATPLLDFHPSQVYHMQCGSIGGHIFIVVDGKLILELTDPDPIDSEKYGRIGFEAYCTRLKITDFCIRRIKWHELNESYAAEF